MDNTLTAQELRIGNYFTDHENGICQVEQLRTFGASNDHHNRFGVQYRNGSCWCEIDSVYPIKLSPDWLERMGFNKEGYTNYSIQTWDRGTLWALCHEDGVSIEIGNNVQHIIAHRAAIQYVHQLQNLYFALTSEELTIKPI